MKAEKKPISAYCAFLRLGLAWNPSEEDKLLSYHTVKCYLLVQSILINLEKNLT